MIIDDYFEVIHPESAVVDGGYSMMARFLENHGQTDA